MKKQIKEIPSILFLMISFGVAIRVMTGGKEEVPLHWNVRGEIDSWGDTWTIRSSSCHRLWRCMDYSPFCNVGLNGITIPAK